MSKLKFALVGCGRISSKHIDSIKELSDAELVAVCDIVEDKAIKAAQKANVKYYTSYDEMLKNEDVDIVVSDESEIISDNEQDEGEQE